MPESVSEQQLVRFGVFELDPAAHELRKNGRRVHLQDQPFGILRMLVARPGEVVTREELRREIWADDTFIDFDNSLNASVAKLREALGDSAANARFIATVPRQGYRFVGVVERAGGHLHAAELRPPQDGGNVLTTREHRRERWTARLQTGLPWLLLAATVACLIWIGMAPDHADVATPTRQFRISTPGPMSVSYLPASLAVSPNGRYIAMATSGESGQLWIHDLSVARTRALENTAHANAPFWSPDSRFVAFAAGSQLKAVAVDGPETREFCNLPSPRFRGGAWSENGEYAVFVGDFLGDPGGLLRVPSVGGSVEEFLRWDAKEFGHGGGPQFVNGGADVLVTVSSGVAPPRRLALVDIGAAAVQVVGRGTDAIWSPTGHILHRPSEVGREIWALPFSLEERRATGEAFPLGYRGGYPSVAGDGTLVYLSEPTERKQWTWLDRRGRPLKHIAVGRDDALGVEISPDGRYIAHMAREGFEPDLWVFNLEASTQVRVTSDPRRDLFGRWSPDGSTLIFTSNRAGGFDLYETASDGTGAPLRITSSPDHDFASDWSRDGEHLLYIRYTKSTGDDLWYLERHPPGEWKEEMFLQTPHNERFPKLSPDGRYIAYVSDQTGVEELYVRTFPDGDEQWTVSSGGATSPRWSPRGDELYYAQGPALMAARVSLLGDFQIGRPAKLFDDPGLATSEFDVCPDGEHFVVMESAEGSVEEPEVVVVQNWFAGFREQIGQ